jgi:lipopolysaccharide/colanic/teichoic acid biosynthesis glycosyltransferase
MNSTAIADNSIILGQRSALPACDTDLVNSRQTHPLYRLFNIAVALLLLVALAPFFLLGILLVRLSGPGPIFYRQTRVGFLGDLFEVIKLRTMVVDAEQGRGAVWASKGDDRVTRFGRLLRRTRIDELPQLFNVLAGDMNVIGPRPERPEFFSFLSASIQGYANRLAVKPGLTGWAQVKNGYADSVDATRLKQQYDMHYVHNQGLWLDLKILLATVRVVLTGHGAH